MTDPKAAAEAALTPTTFNFAEAVLDRSYPEFSVPVYLNELAVQKMVTTSEARFELETRIARSNNPGVDLAVKLEELQGNYEQAVDALKADEYTVVVRGISPEASIKLDDLSYEAFPKEFEESTSPITGQVTKNEIPSDDRDEEFVLLLRQAHLVSVTAPNGAVDTDWSDKEKVRAMFARLPLMARAKIDEAIQGCTIAVDFYRQLADEVF